MGPYPVNAARYIFEDEPIEVASAVGTKHPQSGFPQNFYDTVAVTLRFPENRLAQFNLSYFGNPSNSLIAVGTEGTLELDPAYTFGKGLEQTITIGEKKEEHSFKNTDHFGGELKYFSDCILNDEISRAEWRRRLCRCSSPGRNYCGARKRTVCNIGSLRSVSANRHGASEDHFTGGFDP